MTVQADDYSYFPRLNDREKINDLVHKIAKGRKIPYHKAWSVFVYEFRKAHKLDLFTQKLNKETLVDVVVRMNLCAKAKDVLHNLTGGILRPYDNGPPDPEQIRINGLKV